MSIRRYAVMMTAVITILLSSCGSASPAAASATQVSSVDTSYQPTTTTPAAPQQQATYVEPEPVQPAEEVQPEVTYVADDFVIEGKWKSVGEYGYGQAQPGSIVIFDGANCNFVSPSDTYAFYMEDGVYILDCTTMMFSTNISFTINVIDNDNIEAHHSGTVTVLKRVG